MNDVVAMLGHNKPPEAAKIAADRVGALIANVNEWMKRIQIIDTEEVAADCNDLLTQLDKHWQEFDRLRRDEKKPFDDGAAAVQAKWKPLLDRLVFCKAAIKPLHDAYLKLKDARLKAERQAAEREATEAQRRADQLAEQAKAGGSRTATNLIAATEAAGEAERARQAVAAVPQRAQSRGTLSGRARSLRTSWHATVVDQDLCYRHFRERREIKEMLTKLANEAARSGVRNPDLPGCWVFSEES